MTIQDLWDSLLENLFTLLMSAGILIGGGLIIWGICVEGSHIVHWLRTSQWTPDPFAATILPLFPPSSPFLSWLYDPQDWYGVHRLVWDALELRLSLVLFCVAVVSYITTIFFLYMLCMIDPRTHRQKQPTEAFDGRLAHGLRWALAKLGDHSDRFYDYLAVGLALLFIVVIALLASAHVP